MMRRDAKGVESLPIVLLLGAVLAASTLAIGTACLDLVQGLRERQRAIGSFNTFVERAHMVSTGGVGNVQQVELELAGGKLVFDANLVQLIYGGEVLRSETLPLPVVWDGGDLIDAGSYAIELLRGGEGEYFLKLRGL
ncbi:MAG: hypothetical protein ACE5OT_02290 [Candidatus Hadarchaeaceae archaeon]